jgi:hypothetical protein
MDVLNTFQQLEIIKVGSNARETKQSRCQY